MIGNTADTTADDWVVFVDSELKHEEKQPHASAELDLCFLCDCTASMSSYIRAAQQHICEIAQGISQSQGAQVRFGLVSYRDHPPQDFTYVTQIFEFTSDVAQMKANVDNMSAAGGGDGPEAVTAALHDALHLPWRPHATKVVVLIADAPPHGLEPTGDGFPNGDPEGRDPLQIARDMAARGIACYAVGCEPALGGYHFARDFMCTLSEITGGQAVALSSASLLAEVIVNGSSEEISLTKLQREVQQEVTAVQAAALASAEVLDKDECARRACQSLQSRGVMTGQMQTDGGMVNSTWSVWHSSPATTLSGVKATLSAEMPGPASAPARPGGSYGMLSGFGGSYGMLSGFGAGAGVPTADMYRGGEANLLRSAPPFETYRGGDADSFQCAPPFEETSISATMNSLSWEPISAGQVQRLMQRGSM